VTKSLDLDEVLNDLLADIGINITSLQTRIQEITEPLEDAIFNIVLESCRTAVVGDGGG